MLKACFQEKGELREGSGVQVHARGLAMASKRVAIKDVVDRTAEQDPDYQKAVKDVSFMARRRA